MATEKHFSLVGIALMLVLLQTVVAKSLKENKLYGQNNIGKLTYKLKGMINMQSNTIIQVVIKMFDFELYLDMIWQYETEKLHVAHDFSHVRDLLLISVQTTFSHLCHDK